jgi:hypothetical protein
MKKKSHLRNNAEVVHVPADDLERRPILHEGIILDPEPSRRLAADLTPHHARAPEVVPPIQHRLGRSSRQQREAR